MALKRGGGVAAPPSVDGHRIGVVGVAVLAGLDLGRAALAGTRGLRADVHQLAVPRVVLVGGDVALPAGLVALRAVYAAVFGDGELGHHVGFGADAERGVVHLVEVDVAALGDVAVAHGVPLEQPRCEELVLHVARVGGVAGAAGEHGLPCGDDSRGAVAVAGGDVHRGTV